MLEARCTQRFHEAVMDSLLMTPMAGHGVMFPWLEATFFQSGAIPFGFQTVGFIPSLCFTQPSVIYACARCSDSFGPGVGSWRRKRLFPL